MAFTNLKDIFKTIIKWEKKLNKLFEVAEFGIKNKDSHKIITYLKKMQINNLEIIENVNIKNFGPNEWIQFLPTHKDKDLIPKKDINRRSTPGEIINQILEYDKKMKEFYLSIFNNVKNKNQKDLFDSLVKFKDWQISEIYYLKEYYG